jgi:N-glycosylase/DNA lyase
MVTTRRCIALSQLADDKESPESPAEKIRTGHALTAACVLSSLPNPVTPPTPKPSRTNNVFQINVSSKYHDLMVSPHEFRPSATLTTGQCFHWFAVSSPGDASAPRSAWGRHNATEWIGTLRLLEGHSVVIAIKETSDTTLYRVLQGPPHLPYEEMLRQYFQLDCSLVPLYEAWSRQDPERLARIAKCIRGVRLIEQDPWECLISFICSTNNNIPRITKILSALRQHYGKPLMSVHVDGQDMVLHSFPSLKEMKLKATEHDLRHLCGVGYRAKFIMATIDTLESLGGEFYLQELRRIKDPIQVQEKLLVFPGVGRKVADCVALFSLRQSDAIPVDTHVWNLCRRDYDEDNTFENVKSLTPAIYRQVGDVFRAKFTPKAGWAHSLLFVAELPSFRPALDDCVVDEMDQVSLTIMPHYLV